MNLHVLDEAYIPELGQPHRGKVRENYNLADGNRLVITTDRLSAFDRILCCVPEKGRILTEITKHWFETTKHMCPNHMIDSPDPNVLLVKNLRILPVEIVVRDYLAGTTSTSLLTMYKRYRSGRRNIYGYVFPDGLRDNQVLPFTVITPTTKSYDHDEPVDFQDVVTIGLMTEKQWIEVQRLALIMFTHARTKLAACGLILADTKFEFGLDEDDNIVLADEVLTPDSCRLWFADGYKEAFEAGKAPPSFDKDVVRRWVSERCDPYAEMGPTIPEDVIAETSRVYISAYERILGKTFVPTDLDEGSILDRVQINVSKYFLKS